MPIKSRENLIGAWAFSTGTVVAVIVGLVIHFFSGIDTTVTRFLLTLLTILGLIVGYFVAEKDVNTFLIASVSLVIVSSAGIQGGFVGTINSSILGVADVSKLITNILATLMMLFISATIVVAIKTVFALAKS